MCHFDTRMDWSCRHSPNDIQVIEFYSLILMGRSMARGIRSKDVSSPNHLQSKCRQLHNRFEPLAVVLALAVVLVLAQALAVVLVLAVVLGLGSRCYQDMLSILPSKTCRWK